MPHREQSSLDQAHDLAHDLAHEQDQKQWQRRIEWRLRWLEAGFYLLSARLMLALFPFSSLMSWLSRPRQWVEMTRTERVHNHRAVRNAFLAVEAYLGQQKSTCLHRAMAAQMMLRRRGISTTLYFGVARLTTTGLSPHAWLLDGKDAIIGYLIAQRNRYTVVASYPEDVQSIGLTLGLAHHEPHSVFRNELGDNHEQL